MVVFEGMGALVAAVAVEAVGVEHQVEVLAGFLEGVNQEQSVLMTLSSPVPWVRRSIAWSFLKSDG